MSPLHRADDEHAAVAQQSFRPPAPRGRYDLGEVIGRGGMAEVRIGTDRRLGRTVAVKTLRTDLAKDPIFQARFRREAQSAASLNHPSIVAVYDTGEELVDDVALPYIVMEYVEGRTLRDVLREGRRILPERALEIVADVLSALDYSHRAGIIHRDIKPANVMLTPNGDVKVMDFGIARTLGDDASSTMTQTAAVIGTAQYLSPEQAQGTPVDARSDIYATGCLLYELLCGRPPFEGDSPVSVAYQHVREEPRPPSMIDPEISPAADAITLKALAKRPDHRHQSAAAMRDEIERGLSGQQVTAPVAVRRPEATSRFGPADDRADHDPPTQQWSELGEDDGGPNRRRWLAYAMLGIAMLAALSLVGYIAVNDVRHPDQPTTTVAPTLTGKTVAEATAILDSKRLQLGTTRHHASDSVPRGKIISQQPGPGGTVSTHSAVDIVVSDGKPTIKVPDVTGQQVAEANSLLASQGFKVQEHPDQNSREAAGTVIKVRPRAGAEVPPGTTVTLIYSRGLVEVPDVTNQDVDQAQAQLEDAGFKVRKLAKDTVAAPARTVIDQTPQPGTKRERGATITIVVAREPTPTPTPTDDGPILRLPGL